MGFETLRLRIAVLSVLALATAGALAAQSSLTIVKSTNGQDANVPPGPIVAVGAPVTWTYLVTNSGGRDLTAVSVADDQFGSVSCPSTALAAGTSMTCTATGIAVAGQYTNLGTVTATEAGAGTVTASDTSHYFGQPPGLITLVKATNGQDANAPPGPIVSAGSTITWTYLVANTSSDSLTAVSVTDDQGVTVSCPQSTLVAGASMTCTATGTAISGQYANVGTVTATHPVVGTIVASDSSHYFGQSQSFDFGDAPDIYGTSFAANGARHALGSNVYLGVCVDAELDGQPTAAADGDDGNAGSSTSGVCTTPGADENGVTFNNSLVVGQSALITVVANAPCTLSAWVDFGVDGTFVTSGDNIFPGGTALSAGSNALAFNIPATATPGATYARFRCTTDGAVGPTGAARDGEVEDYHVTIVPSADLSIAKAGSPDPVVPGTSLTYTITVSNAGPSNAASVTVADPLPAGSTFISLTAPAGWNCTMPAAGAQGTVSCTIASLAPGNAAFTIVTAIDGATVSGRAIANTVTVSSPTSDPNPANNSATAIVTAGAQQADLSLTKVGTPAMVTAGSNLTYTITVSNSGPSTPAAVLTDALPAGTTFVSIAIPAAWGCTSPAPGSGGTVSCTTPSLPAGTSVFTLTAAVEASLASGVTIANTATVSSTATDPVPSNNSQTATSTTRSLAGIPLLSAGAMVLLFLALAALGVVAMRSE